MNWDEFFIQLARCSSSKSKDPSTKVGCVIVNSSNEVLALGYNGFPRGVKDTEERYANKDVKYSLVAHAEANAICISAKNGAVLDGATIYITHPPCGECAKLIVQSGIKKVVWQEIEDSDMAKRWSKSIDISTLIFRESRINFYTVRG